LGGRSVFFRQYCVMSYAMARLKTDQCHSYRPSDQRVSWRTWSIKSEAELRALIAEGGKEYHLVQPGGAWWGHTAQAIAERDGDTGLAARLKKENAAALTASVASLARRSWSLQRK
jgi:hypothetical protein